MRLYSFVNGLYLNQLQYGLQTAHCVSRLSLQNNNNFKEWAENHETIIILDATNSRGVKHVHHLLSFVTRYYGIDIPFVIFNEDGDSLDGAITCTACVLPESVYGLDKEIRRDEAKFIVESLNTACEENDFVFFKNNTPEYLLFCIIKSYNLASH